MIIVVLVVAVSQRATVPTPRRKLPAVRRRAPRRWCCALRWRRRPRPTAQAADGRELLANAIANTHGSYLVYNFGGGHPAPMLNAGGSWYEMSNGGHLMIIKSASQRLAPATAGRLAPGYQARCERDPRAPAPAKGCWQASEIYTPLQAWQALGQPTIAINANFFDVRGQKGGSWKSHRMQFAAGRLRRQHPRAGPRQRRGHRHRRLRGQAGPVRRRRELERAGHDDPAGRRRAVSSCRPERPDDYDAASPVIQGLLDKGARFVAVSGIGLLAPGDTGQLNDGGPSAARTALAYSRTSDEMYVFQGGSYTPDQIQDLFRGLGSDTAVLLDGGGSSAIVLRRDTGGMWAGAGVPEGNCDTRQVLCDSRERALPSWLAFN